MALLAEVVRRPTFPDAEVERLRDERLTDLLQAKADPRRRADEAYVSAIYAPSSPYHRPAGGRAETVGGADGGGPARHPRGRLRPGAGGAGRGGRRRSRCRPPCRRGALRRLGGVRRRRHGAHRRHGRRHGPLRPRHPPARRRPDRDPHRPSGPAPPPPGLPRRVRDERDPGRPVQLAAEHEAPRGEGLHLRRQRRLRPAAGEGSVHAPGRPSTRRPRSPRSRSSSWSWTGSGRTRVTDAELAAARDYLVGVFPLRFETPGPVAGSLAGLFVHGLPDDELARYRGAIEAVTADDVLRVARDHIHPETAAIILVGDHYAFGEALAAAGIAPVDVQVDPEPATSARSRTRGAGRPGRRRGGRPRRGRRGPGPPRLGRAGGSGRRRRRCSPGRCPPRRLSAPPASAAASPAA